jgi:hypothetical protein
MTVHGSLDPLSKKFESKDNQHAQPPYFVGCKFLKIHLNLQLLICVTFILAYITETVGS